MAQKLGDKANLLVMTAGEWGPTGLTVSLGLRPADPQPGVGHPIQRPPGFSLPPLCASRHAISLSLSGPWKFPTATPPPFNSSSWCLPHSREEAVGRRQAPYSPDSAACEREGPLPAW